MVRPFWLEWSCPGFVDTSPLERIGVVERSP
jgi:hypothetical protein